MAHLTGNGAPGKNTQAAVGDIYIDKVNKVRYKCIFTYKDSDSKKYDCQWEKLEWQNPEGSDALFEADNQNMSHKRTATK